MLPTDRRPTYDELVEEVRRLSNQLAYVVPQVQIPSVWTGWTCPQCGQWVYGYGTFHACWASTRTDVSASEPTWHVIDAVRAEETVQRG